LPFLALQQINKTFHM